MDLKEDGLVDPSKHWYYVTKVRAIRSLVEQLAPKAQTLLDVGAGSGFFAKELLSSGELALRRAVCVDPKYVEDRFEGDIAFRRDLPDEPAELLLLLDVLEHVPDDRALLSDSLQMLAPGGVVVITVPAFMSLWSSHDVYLDHFRRYRLEQVVDLAETSGLEVLTRRYLFGSLFPIAFLVRRLFRSNGSEMGSDLRPIHPVIDRILRGWFSLEHIAVRQRVFGVTAVVACRKSGTSSDP